MTSDIDDLIDRDLIRWEDEDEAMTTKTPEELAREIMGAALPDLLTWDATIILIAAALRQYGNEKLEEAAGWADKHKGSATRRRLDRGNKLRDYDDAVVAEIQAEERGEDIAAEIIAVCIRALKDKS